MFKTKVINILGIILVLLGISMLPSALWNLPYIWTDMNANLDFATTNYYIDTKGILLSSLITTIIGLALYLWTKNYKLSNHNQDLQSRDGFIIVGLGWMLMAFFSALPFYFSAYSITYTDAFFESMSGLTTTGASILGQPISLYESNNQVIKISSLSDGLLFWRSFTHFIGGMGIIVFSIAILPLLGIGGVQLFRAEVAGPVAEKITPRVKQTAKLLWGIYVGFIIIQTIVLNFQGFTWLESFCHSFGTMATGGFSTFDESILGAAKEYSKSNSFYFYSIQWTFIIFMFIAATNFTLHYAFISKKSFDYFKDGEFKTYCYIFGLISILLFVTVFFNSNEYNSIIKVFTDSVFTTISLLTTTGFGTIDYITEWPESTHVFIFFLLFIGGTAGSTTGGIKIIRTILVFKYISYEIKKLIHPKGVYNIKLAGNVVPDSVVKTTLGFYLFYIFIFIFTAIIFALFGNDLLLSLSASASAIGNIGPGLGEIGPSGNWAHFNPILKWISAFCMLLGRLEIFTVMVLFTKVFWKI